MAFNLLRNTRAFFTTNVDATTGAVLNGDAGSPFTSSNTFEIQVLDGLSFSQNTAEDTVTLNEAGATPSRGQRSFNTALDPVDFSFSTYIRPRYNDSGTSDTVEAEESHLWGAFVSADGNVAANGWTSQTTAATAPVSTVNWSESNTHQFKKFGMIFLVDQTAFIIDNCALDQATIDFGLDAISTIAWTGKGTKLRKIDDVTATSITNDGDAISFTGFSSGSQAKGKYLSARYLANKLSTCYMNTGINDFAGITANGTADFAIPITGGSITFSNNISYLTPANLGVVNQPVTYFAGTRAISGNITAYLKTGDATATGALLNELLAGSSTDIQPKYTMGIAIGGKANSTKVEINMAACKLAIPSVNTEQVVSVGINFTAQGSASGVYDIGATNEAEIKYYTVV